MSLMNLGAYSEHANHLQKATSISATTLSAVPVANMKPNQKHGVDNSSEAAASSLDVTSYLGRLTRTRLLSAAEEARLARRIVNNDQAAKMRMIEANMRLVVSIAKSYISSGLPLEDLVQEGSIGLMTAMDRFDPDRGYRFSTYATQWIRQAIGRAIDNKSKSIRLPAHISEALRKVEKARADLKRQLGAEPPSDMVAAAAGISTKKMRALEQTIQEPISLDTPVGDSDNTSLGSLLLDKSSTDPEDSVIEDETRMQIEGILQCLDEREQTIMRSRFGFGDDQMYVLHDIGEKLGISRERVRQLEVQAIRKLRAAARKKRLREYLQN